MAEIGSLTWIAEIQEIAKSKRSAEEMNEGLEGLAEQARETDAAMEGVGDASGGLSDSFGGLGRQSGFLSGALGLLSSGFLLLIGQITGATGIVATLTGAVKGLYAWLAAGGLSGVIGTVSGLLSGFVGWLAAGSVGALAFAGAIGASIGLIVTWGLEMLGVLDIIRDLGTMLADVLPGWARDAIIAVIGIFAGGLAVLGGMIVGFVGSGGDLQAALERGEEVLQIFAGAWERLTTGIMETLRDWKTDAVALATSVAEDLTSAVTGAVTGLWNTVIPDSITIPEIVIGGQTISTEIPHVGTVGGTLPKTTIGGDTIDFPQLQTGGLIEEGGGAVLHEGEMVLPADVSRDVIAAIRQAGSGGGGGTTLNIEQQIIEIGDQMLDLSELTRTQMETLADLIAGKQGDELSTLIG